MSVLVDIILQLPEVAFVLPRPQDAELTKVCRTIQESPAREHSVEYWANHLGMSARTFSRHFKRNRVTVQRLEAKDAYSGIGVNAEEK